MRGHCRGNPWLHSQSKAPLGPPSPGKGHHPCGHSPALTLQQVGDKQRCALVAAGQPPQCQVLLDLEGEEVPVERDRSMPWGVAGLRREPGAGLSPEGSAAGGLSAPLPLPALAHVSAQGMQVCGVTRGACSPRRRLQLGTTMTSITLPLKRPLVGFRVNIPLCFGGHLHLSGLMFCRSTVLVLFLVPVRNAFSKM